MSQDRRYKILLIEGDAGDRQAFERFAKENESLCTAECAASVVEAREALSAKSFDVVITDYRLGDGTAFDVISLVEDAPVIFATRAGGEEVAIRALKAGATDYFVKDEERTYLKLMMLTIVRAMGRRRAERQARMLSEALKGISDAVCVSDADGWIIFANEAFCRIYGYSPQEALQEKADALWPEGKAPADVAGGRREALHRRKDGAFFPVDYSRTLLVAGAGGAAVAVHVSRDVTAEKAARAEKEKLIAELQAALGEVKKLSGLLPICANCKMIRDEKGKWDQVESYISMHSEAGFTHGVCPDCVRKLYPEYAEELGMGAPPVAAGAGR